MSRIFNLWTLAQAELLHVGSMALDFLAAHRLTSGPEQHRQASEDAGHLAAAASRARVDIPAGINTAFPPDPPAPHAPHGL